MTSSSEDTAELGLLILILPAPTLLAPIGVVCKKWQFWPSGQRWPTALSLAMLVSRSGLPGSGVPWSVLSGGGFPSVKQYPGSWVVTQHISVPSLTPYRQAACVNRLLLGAEVPPS